jgi:hypothetical protein
MEGACDRSRVLDGSVVSHSQAGVAGGSSVHMNPQQALGLRHPCQKDRSPAGCKIDRTYMK